MADANFTISDDADPTKQLKFQCSGITTATTRTLTVPDASDTLVGKATTDVLTNKTLTTPTIGSFANATHTHANAAGGGQITSAALSDYTEWTTFTPTRAASAGTWTAGTVSTCKYKIVGKSLHLLIQILISSVSATPDTLQITLPASKTATSAVLGALTISDNGTAKTGSWRVNAAGTSILFYTGPAATGTWATATTTTSIYLSAEFEIN